MDPLSLSVSDLHHHEYTDFTPCFADLMTVIESANDPEKFAVPLVLARSFVHGRYPKLSLAILDRVCISLSPPPNTFSPPRARSFARMVIKIRPLAGGSSLPSFVSSTENVRTYLNPVLMPRSFVPDFPPSRTSSELPVVGPLL
jgi:hypothetical protein